MAICQAVAAAAGAGGGSGRGMMRSRPDDTAQRTMPDITLIDPDGTTHGFEAPDGLSVMQAATGFGVPGILADCGGQAICGTCHVIVADAWIARLPPPGPAEDERLDAVAVGRSAGSRLACQIKLGPALQGLVMSLPERQQ